MQLRLWRVLSIDKGQVATFEQRFVKRMAAQGFVDMAIKIEKEHPDFFSPVMKFSAMSQEPVFYDVLERDAHLMVDNVMSEVRLSAGVATDIDLTTQESPMSSKNSTRKRSPSPKRLSSLAHNYTPNATQARFHTDHGSPIKIIVGGVATGTSTALAIEMLMCEGRNNLLVVSGFNWFKMTLERTLKQWCKDCKLGAPNHLGWVVLNGCHWRLVEQKDLRDVLAAEPEYDNVAVAGVPFDNHAVSMLSELSEHCKGSGQVFGEFKPPVKMLPDLFGIAKYAFPPLFVAQGGELAVNPALETWHMPNGSGYFEDLLRLNYNKYAEAYGVSAVAESDWAEPALSPEVQVLADEYLAFLEKASSDAKNEAGQFAGDRAIPHRARQAGYDIAAAQFRAIFNVRYPS